MVSTRLLYTAGRPPHTRCCKTPCLLVPLGWAADASPGGQGVLWGYPCAGQDLYSCRDREGGLNKQSEGPESGSDWNHQTQAECDAGTDALRCRFGISQHSSQI